MKVLKVLEGAELVIVDCLTSAPMGHIEVIA